MTDKGLDPPWHLPALDHLELGATAVGREWARRFQGDHPKCHVRSGGVDNPHLIQEFLHLGLSYEPPWKGV